MSNVIEHHPPTADIDRKKILKHLLEHARLTTLQAREELGIMSPAPRVLELRRLGHNIVTTLTNERDITGRKHRQAEYGYFSGGIKE
ncbi:MAG: hypothetical protein COB23_07180 [Methylophaga sp.]|nr:MAG: hypothetical protein COB23_07180 [Methylophaga sp.]